MNQEQWDYKIDGKTAGILRNVVCFVLAALFVVLTIDQLQAQPNKSLVAALAFGSIAVAWLSILITGFIRYVWFRVYIGGEGFYFQSNPFNGKYYKYADVESCREERKTYLHRNSSDLHCYYFIFAEKTGKSTKFLFEKTVYEREINVLKSRIENN